MVIQHLSPFTKRRSVDASFYFANNKFFMLTSLYPIIKFHSNAYHDVVIIGWTQHRFKKYNLLLLIRSNTRAWCLTVRDGIVIYMRIENYFVSVLEKIKSPTSIRLDLTKNWRCPALLLSSNCFDFHLVISLLHNKLWLLYFAENCFHIVMHAATSINFKSPCKSAGDWSHF